MRFLKGFSKPDSSSDTGVCKPQLTSLVDVMTILLVFLIKSFSTDGNIITPAADLELPVSTAEKPAQVTCAIEISKSALIIDGNTVCTLSDIAKSDSLMVPSLYKWMSVLKANCGHKQNSSELLIQCDREIEYAIVKKVMYTCTKAGYSDFSILVVQENG